MTEHYFASSPKAVHHRLEFTTQIQGKEYVVCTDSGVFSPRQLDKGTAVLLHKLPTTEVAQVNGVSLGSSVTVSPGDFVLDLGCGWGPISLALAHNYPEAAILAVDVNERARELCAENLKRNGYTNFSTLDPETALTELRKSEAKLKLIWSNPPIRIGKEELHQMLRTWLELLAEDGVGYFVVQRNLGADSLQKWLQQEGYRVGKLGSAKGFRVLEVRK
ncbi:MAG: methyltransferase [Arcanobacterium sp.]|nr:methyltransferase [Arcanobacterium sp.]